MKCSEIGHSYSNCLMKHLPKETLEAKIVQFLVEAIDPSNQLIVVWAKVQDQNFLIFFDPRYTHSFSFLSSLPNFPDLNLKMSGTKRLILSNLFLFHPSLLPQPPPPLSSFFLSRLSIKPSLSRKSILQFFKPSFVLCW